MCEEIDEDGSPVTRFKTASGLANFYPIELEVKNPEGRLRLSTRRGKQFNSLVYAEVDPINGAQRDAVLMNSEDASKLGLAQRDPIALTNELGRFEGRVFLAPIAPGNLQIHWPEGNVIIRRGVVDPAGGVPDYNARVRVEKVGSESFRPPPRP